MRYEDWCKQLSDHCKHHTCSWATRNNPHDTDAEEEACSGPIADLSHIRTQWCLADCLTKKSANPQALIDAARQGILKEVDAHPPFRTLVEHNAYLRSWLLSVCHLSFAVDVLFLGERFHWRMCAENLLACRHFCSLVCTLAKMFVSFYEFVPAAQLFELALVCWCCWYL